jgi:hypothetical protein
MTEEYDWRAEFEELGHTEVRRRIGVGGSKGNAGPLCNGAGIRSGLMCAA